MYLRIFNPYKKGVMELSNFFEDLNTCTTDLYNFFKKYRLVNFMFSDTKCIVLRGHEYMVNQ